MSDSNQMNERVSWPDQRTIAVPVQWITRDNFALCRQLCLRSWTHQNPHSMSALQKNRQQRAADIPGSAGDKDAAEIFRLG